MYAPPERSACSIREATDMPFFTRPGIFPSTALPMAVLHLHCTLAMMS